MAVRALSLPGRGSGESALLICHGSRFSQRRCSCSNNYRKREERYAHLPRLCHRRHPRNLQLQPRVQEACPRVDRAAPVLARLPMVLEAMAAISTRTRPLCGPRQQKRLRRREEHCRLTRPRLILHLLCRCLWASLRMHQQDFRCRFRQMHLRRRNLAPGAAGSPKRRLLWACQFLLRDRCPGRFLNLCLFRLQQLRRTLCSQQREQI